MKKTPPVWPCLFTCNYRSRCKLHKFIVMRFYKSTPLLRMAYWNRPMVNPTKGMYVTEKLSNKCMSFQNPALNGCILATWITKNQAITAITFHKSHINSVCRQISQYICAVLLYIQCFPAWSIDKNMSYTMLYIIQCIRLGNLLLSLPEKGRRIFFINVL